MYKVAGMDIKYSQDDFDNLYEAINLTDDGLVSRSEMRNFLYKMGKKAEA